MKTIATVEEQDGKRPTVWEAVLELEKCAQMSAAFIELMIRCAWVDKTENWARSDDVDCGLDALSGVIEKAQFNALARLRQALAEAKETASPQP